MYRVSAYVDGFNLYYGLRDKYGHKYMWLNIHKLISSLLTPKQSLSSVKYFTSLVTDNPAKEKRQMTYLEALKAVGAIEIVFGKYKLSSFKCPACRAETFVPSEKMTDVNISVTLIEDAIMDLFDTALLVSGDSDLTPAVTTIKQIAPTKRVIVAFPPRRSAVELQEAAYSNFVIGRRKFASSQLPEAVTSTNGFLLTKPERWS